MQRLAPLLALTLGAGIAADQTCNAEGGTCISKDSALVQVRARARLPAHKQCQFVVQPETPYYWDERCYMGLAGCWADGVNEKCRFCDYEGIPCPDGSWHPGTAACDFEVLPVGVGFYYESRCPEVEAGLGCLADGKNMGCRFCGGADEYKNIPCPQQCTFENEPATPYYYDPSCYNGELGCLADGLHVGCRFCGKRPFESVPCPEDLGVNTGKCWFRNEPKVSYYWDDDCAMGKVGCWADGLHAECRFCGGEGPFSEVPCPKGLRKESLLQAATGTTLEATTAPATAPPTTAAPAATTAATAAATTAPATTTLPAAATTAVATTAAATTAPATTAPETTAAATTAAEATTSEAGTSLAPVSPAGQCEFVVPPAIPYYWDETCEMGIVGCWADGRNAKCRFCEYAGIPCPEEAVNPGTVGCDFPNWPVGVGVYYEPSCPTVDGGLGCLADGKHWGCRFCGGNSSYQPIACPEQCTFANEPSTPYFYDSTCENGMLGCLADGIHVKCRFCGSRPFDSVPCPDEVLPAAGEGCWFRDEPEVQYYWDPSCEMGQLGCWADGVHAECRFCGDRGAGGAFGAVPCPEAAGAAP